MVLKGNIEELREEKYKKLHVLMSSTLGGTALNQVSVGL